MDNFYKENGREIKTNREIASESTKIMHCSKCDYQAHVKSIEFGEQERCPECGGILMENIK